MVFVLRISNTKKAIKRVILSIMGVNKIIKLAG